MQMLTLDSFLWFLPLKWGVLIIGIVDTTVCTTGIVISEKLRHILAWYIIAISIYVMHIMSCILLLTTLCVKKPYLAIFYLISIVILLLNSSAIFIWHTASLLHYTNVSIIEYIIMTLGIYFWICAFSWYTLLKEPTAQL